ncbi:MAG: ATP-binding protein [Candidatus Riflebacteria bacterium]|nr:ATP-binding protein [Candidatus Riflebacteria bacterium]
MERIKEKDIYQWFKSKRRKPLVIWGARQTGKTYLVKELFAQKHFDDFLYIDLKRDKDARDFFSTTSNPDEYLTYIETRYGKKISNELPLIFDEVQICQEVLSSLKYFCQDYPQLPVIATGSLVRLSIRQQENKDSNNFLFPVGKIDSMNIYPMGFEEYLLNTNKKLLKIIKDGYSNKTPLKTYEHELALNALYEFLTIGGLPEALNVFIEEKSYIEATKVIKEVYSNYLADMDTYNISNETILKTRNVYKNIFFQLNKENKNFKISVLEKGKSNRDYFNAYQWLELANVIYRSKIKTGKVSLPLIEETNGLFRMYLADEGMFAFQSQVSQSDFFVKDKRNTLSGIFYENYVADEFVMKGIPLFYWTGKNSHEFEFILYNNGKILPVDVKKDKGKLNSLDEFRSYNPKSTAIKISVSNFGYNKERDILTIPLYEVFLLADDIVANKPII